MIKQEVELTDEYLHDNPLYVNLTEEQEVALDGLEDALERVRKAGCSTRDVRDTIKAWEDELKEKKDG